MRSLLNTLLLFCFVFLISCHNDYPRRRYYEKVDKKFLYGKRNIVGVFNLLPDTVIVFSMFKRLTKNELNNLISAPDTGKAGYPFVGHLARGQAFYYDYTKYHRRPLKPYYIFLIRSHIYTYNHKQLSQLISHPNRISVILDENLLTTFQPFSLPKEMKEKVIRYILHLYQKNGKKTFHGFLYERLFLFAPL